MSEWIRYRGGRGWRRRCGLILAEWPSQASGIASLEVDGGYLYRTRGEPTSMRQLFADYEPLLREAWCRFGVPEYTLMALIGIEASRLKSDQLRFDPRSIRLEPGYRSDAKTPNRVSPGLMQTLLSTAQEVLPDVPELQHETLLEREDLFVPRYSILLGAAYVKQQMDRLEPDEEGLPADDPVLNACAAYNAGSVRYTASNDWHLVTYGTWRVDEFIAWSNDAHTVLAEVNKQRAA